MRKAYTITAIGISVVLGIATLVNRGMNNRIEDTPAYHLVSKTRGFSGHTEYIRYKDGSQETKEYPSFGHRLFASRFYQDLNGDGLVDRIRQNAGEWRFNRLTKLLVREEDYQAHKKEFDEADKRLRELSSK